MYNEARCHHGLRCRNNVFPPCLGSRAAGEEEGDKMGTNDMENLIERMQKETHRWGRARTASAERFSYYAADRLK